MAESSVGLEGSVHWKGPKAGGGGRAGSESWIETVPKPKFRVYLALRNNRMRVAF